MEQQLKIPTSDKKKIYGTLRCSLKNSLLILVHGFTGFKDEHIFFNGARFFKKADISYFLNHISESKDLKPFIGTNLRIITP